MTRAIMPAAILFLLSIMDPTCLSAKFNGLIVQPDLPDTLGAAPNQEEVSSSDAPAPAEITNLCSNTEQFCKLETLNPAWLDLTQLRKSDHTQFGKSKCPKKPENYDGETLESEVEFGKNWFEQNKEAINKITHKLLKSVWELVEKRKKPTEGIKDIFTKADHCNLMMSGAIPADDVESVLESSDSDEEFNFREKLGIIECSLLGTKYLKQLINTLAEEAEKENHKLPENLNIEFLKQHYDIMKRHQKAAGQKQSGFSPQFLVEASRDNWITLTGDAYTSGGVDKLWSGSKDYIAPEDPSNCEKIAINSLNPPLSARESKIQCSSNPEPCTHTKWCVGKDYSKMKNGLFQKFAKHCGFLTVGGPSGHTINYLVLAKILGFDDTELAHVRDAMIAWMVSVQDHTLLEIIATADPFMADADKWPSVHMQMPFHYVAV